MGVCFVAVVAVAAGASLLSREPLSASEPDEGRVSIFNGESMDGWHIGIRLTGCNRIRFESTACPILSGA
jgi:hypothetical protein